MYHLYAQYFHPDTLTERVRNVAFYRRPRTIFKGFRVPDWAQSENHEQWQLDTYSREAWTNAIQDMESEMTPMMYNQRRQEPNPLQWFRLEGVLGGAGARLFYNEVPKLSWRRQKGHLTETDDDREKERALFSFTHANQDRGILFGLDTSTPEGAEAFKKEYEMLCEMAPELIKREDMILPHQLPAKVSTEPHFQRVWQHYREWTFRAAVEHGVQEGQIEQADADAMNQFIGLT